MLRLPSTTSTPSHESQATAAAHFEPGQWLLQLALWLGGLLAAALLSIVFVAGVIPQQDYGFLYEAGVKGIYGPGTPIPASAKDVLEQIRKAVA